MFDTIDSLSYVRIHGNEERCTIERKNTRQKLAIYENQKIRFLVQIWDITALREILDFFHCPYPWLDEDCFDKQGEQNASNNLQLPS